MKTENWANYCQIEKKLSRLSSIYLKELLPLLLIKMKNKNFSSRNSKQIRLEAEDINTSEKGITKALLEKYKVRIICNLGTLSDRKIQNRVA